MERMEITFRVMASRLIADKLNQMVTDGKESGRIDLSDTDYIEVKIERPDISGENAKPRFARCSCFSEGKDLYDVNIPFAPDDQILSIRIMLVNLYDMIDKKAFEDECYNAFQLDWMISHGHTLNDLYNLQLENMQEMFDPKDFEEKPFSKEDLERAMAQARDTFLYSTGFEEGGLFPDKNEFLTHEYMDADYMMHLLLMMYDDGTRSLLERYKKYSGNKMTEYQTDEE